MSLRLQAGETKLVSQTAWTQFWTSEMQRIRILKVDAMVDEDVSYLSSCRKIQVLENQVVSEKNRIKKMQGVRSLLSVLVGWNL